MFAQTKILYMSTTPLLLPLLKMPGRLQQPPQFARPKLADVRRLVCRQLDAARYGAWLLAFWLATRAWTLAAVLVGGGHCSISRLCKVDR